MSTQWPQSGRQTPTARNLTLACGGGQRTLSAVSHSGGLCLCSSVSQPCKPLWSCKPTDSFYRLHCCLCVFLPSMSIAGSRSDYWRQKKERWAQEQREIQAAATQSTGLFSTLGQHIQRTQQHTYDQIETQQQAIITPAYSYSQHRTPYQQYPRNTQTEDTQAVYAHKHTAQRTETDSSSSFLPDVHTSNPNSVGAASPSSVNAKRAAILAYSSSLSAQLSLKAERLKKEKEEREERERREEREAREYNPFGRAGAGAPRRDANGQIIANRRVFPVSASVSASPPSDSNAESEQKRVNKAAYQRMLTEQIEEKQRAQKLVLERQRELDRREEERVALEIKQLQESHNQQHQHQQTPSSPAYQKKSKLQYPQHESEQSVHETTTKRKRQPWHTEERKESSQEIRSSLMQPSEATAWSSSSSSSPPLSSTMTFSPAGAHTHPSSTAQRTQLVYDEMREEMDKLKEEIQRETMRIRSTSHPLVCSHKSPQQQLLTHTQLLPHRLPYTQQQQQEEKMQFIFNQTLTDSLYPHMLSPSSATLTYIPLHHTSMLQLAQLNEQNPHSTRRGSVQVEGEEELMGDSIFSVAEDEDEPEANKHLPLQDQQAQQHHHQESRYLINTVVHPMSSKEEKRENQATKHPVQDDVAEEMDSTTTHKHSSAIQTASLFPLVNQQKKQREQQAQQAPPPAPQQQVEQPLNVETREEVYSPVEEPIPEDASDVVNPSSISPAAALIIEDPQQTEMIEERTMTRSQHAMQTPRSELAGFPIHTTESAELDQDLSTEVEEDKYAETETETEIQTELSQEATDQQRPDLESEDEQDYNGEVIETVATLRAEQGDEEHYEDDTEGITEEQTEDAYTLDTLEMAMKGKSAQADLSAVSPVELNAPTAAPDDIDEELGFD